jgi:REP element-mobilizing transposase RayT
MKANKLALRGGLRSSRRFGLIHVILKTYARKFFVKVEQVSIQNDHIHLILRISRRSLFQNFLRVLSGQIAQRFEHEGLMKVVSVEKSVSVTDTPDGASRMYLEARKDVASAQKQVKLWKYRPFTRVVRGWRAYKTVKDYVQLNEKEARGEIRYSSQRLRALDKDALSRLWA